MTLNEWELNERKDEYLRIGAIVNRFKEIDELYNHSPWTLEQIFANLNILTGIESIDKMIEEIENLSNCKNAYDMKNDIIDIIKKYKDNKEINNG